MLTIIDWLYLFFFSVLIASVVKYAKYKELSPQNSNYVPFNYINCDECNIYFFLTYIILISFLLNFAYSKYKIPISIVLFLPVLRLINLDFNYFLVGVLLICLSAILGFAVKKYNRIPILKINNKRKIKERYNPLLILINYWICIIFIPILFFTAFFKDGGWYFFYFLFIPQLFCIIPYSIFYRKNKLANFSFLLVGLIIPCLCINYLLSVAIIKAFENFGF